MTRLASVGWAVEHGLDARPLQDGLNDTRRDPGALCFGENEREGAGDVLRPALGLGLTQAPHRGVLFHERDELEPDPPGLQRPQEKLGRTMGERRTLSQHGFHLRVTRAYDLAQEIEKKIEELLGVGGPSPLAGLIALTRRAPFRAQSL